MKIESVGKEKNEELEICKEWVDYEVKGYWGGGGGKPNEQTAVKKVHNVLQWILKLNQREGKLKYGALRCNIAENK
jgi:hypothetical protein